MKHPNLSAVSWLDWKLGARLLLKYPALTIIGGLSLAAAIAIGAVGMEVADELLYKRLPFDEGGRVVRLDTQDTARVTRGAEGAPRFRDLAAVSEDGDRARRRPPERAQRAHRRRPCRIRCAWRRSRRRRFRSPACRRCSAGRCSRRTKCRGRSPSWSWATTSGKTVPPRPGDHRPRRDGGSHGSHRSGRDAAAFRLPAQ